MLKLDEQINALAQQFAKEKSLLVMGRGYQFATCLEGALVRRFFIILRGGDSKWNSVIFGGRDVDSLPEFFWPKQHLGTSP